MDGFPKNIHAVNRHLREVGIPVHFRAGTGYYYAVAPGTNVCIGEAVYTYRASQLTFQMWENEARECIRQEAAALYSAKECPR